MQRIISVICVLWMFATGGIHAQDDFNPSNPPEPQVPVFYYPLTVTCDPARAGYTSGRGTYAPGTSVTISTSAYTGYTFSHWELNGEPFTNSQSFRYVTIEGKMDFVAVYDFTPIDPAEPTMNVKSRLYLASDPVGVCTFNRTSGAFVDAGHPVVVSVTNVDQLYEFEGWYLDGVKLSDASSFSYTPNYNDVTLCACFTELPFNPDSPDDPSWTGQDDVQNSVKGDVNGDGVVNISDVTMLVNIILGKATDINGTADVNNDGTTNISDVTTLVNIILGK